MILITFILAAVTYLASGASVLLVANHTKITSTDYGRALVTSDLLALQASPARSTTESFTVTTTTTAPDICSQKCTNGSNVANLGYWWQFDFWCASNYDGTTSKCFFTNQEDRCLKHETLCEAKGDIENVIDERDIWVYSPTTPFFY